MQASPGVGCRSIIWRLFLSHHAEQVLAASFHQEYPHDCRPGIGNILLSVLEDENVGLHKHDSLFIVDDSSAIGFRQ
ncbi:hypothetical protein C8R42DRAFT_690344 [Lentinula raphanica]|nr:hypothetical protein C8R42DRAFT_690344 [Lentinula raphanica]